MSLYKEKYRVESSRLKNWDYASNGYYYVTICTLNRIHYFGDIVNNKIILSTIGKMVFKYWHEIPKHFPFVKLDEFVIMPNHLHGIIIINNHDRKTNNHAELPILADTCTPVETQDFASLPIKTSVIPKKTTVNKNKFGPQSKNIGSIIRGFKIGVSKETKKDKISFAWQPRFYDHIIRNNQDLIRIRKYIQNNPGVWKEDNFFI